MRVVMPFFAGDEWLIRKNLEWMAELDGHLDYDCVLASDNATDHRAVEDLARILFRSVSVLKYGRAYFNNQLMTKWPYQQNNAFLQTARHMATLKPRDSWFWLETDAVPLKPGWLKSIEDEYLRGNKPFGSHINPANGIVNGVGVWPPNVIRWSPKCFTCALLHPNQPPWDAYASDEIRPNTHALNSVMQHLWCLPEQTVEQAPTFPDIASVEKYIRPEVGLFHRCKDGSLIERMREMRNQNINVTLRGIDQVCQRKEVPKTDIFIVSFRRDAEFTRYCLKSIAKFTSGFNKTILVVPTVDEVQFRALAAEFPFVDVHTFDEVPGKGMIHHEAIVCSADQYSDADYIWHIDADCVINQPITPLDYFIDGKPVMLKESYEKLVGNGGFDAGVGQWQKAVTAALGFKPEYETMRRHPAVYPRELYAKVRKAVEAHTKKPFLEYVLSCRNEYPQSFAEFNTLGAWELQYAPDLQHWINCDVEPRPADKLYQMSGKRNMDFVPDDGPLKGRRYRDVIQEVLGA